MDEHFCLTSHMIFVRDWDEKIIAQWGSIGYSIAIILIYPKSTELLTDHGVDDLVQLMCMSYLETNDGDAMVQYAAPACIDKRICRSRD